MTGGGFGEYGDANADGDEGEYEREDAGAGGHQGLLDSSDVPVEPVGGDLWSAPASAVPVSAVLADNLFAGDLLEGRSPELGDGLLAVPLPSPLLPARIAAPPLPTPTARHARRIGPSGRSDPGHSGRRGRSGIALALAVTVLIGLAFLAQRLDPSRGGHGGASGAVSTANPAPTASSGSPGAGQGPVVTGGPPDCPMQLSSAGLDCFFIG